MNENLDDLTEERDGYVMWNAKEEVEIKCTEKSVNYWKQRGFVIKEQGKIRLVDSE